MRRCQYCAEEIPADVTRCPMCASDLSVTPGPAFAGDPPPQEAASAPTALGEGALEFSHSGSRYLLGYGGDFFGIWDRDTAGGPVRSFPRTDDGWAAAWTEYSRIEPNSVAVAVGLGGYRAPAGAVPTSAVAVRRTNGFATASLVLGIAGCLVLIAILSVLALVFGYRARREIASSGGLQSGDAAAVAGIALGWVGVGLWAIMVVLVATHVVH